MLKIHQPYIKRKVRMAFAFASIGVLLLGLGIIIASPATHPSSQVYAAGDSRTIHDISNMQEMTQQICSNTDEGDTATLTDNRDGKPYTIIKQIKDKNCWMQQNLQLNLTGGTAIEGSTKDGAAYSWTPTATTQAYSTSGTWTSNNTAVMSRAGSGTNGNYYTWKVATTTPVRRGELFTEKIGGTGFGSNLKLPINPARSSRRPRHAQSAHINNLREYYHRTDDRITA